MQRARYVPLKPGQLGGNTDASNRGVARRGDCVLTGTSLYFFSYLGVSFCFGIGGIMVFSCIAITGFSEDTTASKGTYLGTIEKRKMIKDANNVPS
jgi:hypothetical protein